MEAKEPLLGMKRDFMRMTNHSSNIHVVQANDKRRSSDVTFMKLLHSHSHIYTRPIGIILH